MSQPQTEQPKKSLVEDFSTMTEKAFEELDATRHDLQEKERLLTNIANESMEKIKELSAINHDLQDKVGFLLDISASLNKKNDELIKLNLELEKQKFHYGQITRDLKSKLDQVLSKEKELSMQRDFLAKQVVDEKTRDLMNAEKFTVIGDLATRLAHDLRNPLSIVKNTVDIMRAKPDMGIEEKLQRFGMFDRAIQRMTHQIDDILNFVKKPNLMLQQTSLLSILDEAIGNTLVPPEVVILKPYADVVINCDSRKLEAVFSNLLNNSIQAMDDKGEIKMRMSDFGYDVQIEFEDTGPGIPLEIQSKVFDPLFTTKPTGTGLGLSICKNIIEQHGGTLTVKSPPTVFTVRLPKNITPKYQVNNSYIV